jgi:hypothetical protein
MEAAGWHVEYIAATHSVSRQQWRDVSTRSQRTRNVGAGNRWSATEQQLGAGRRFKDNPRLVLADRIGAVHHFRKVVIRVHLHRESVLYIEQLHQHAAGPLVGITEPGLADWSARRRIGGEPAKAIATPHAPNEARSKRVRVARCRLSHGESLGE